MAYRPPDADDGETEVGEGHRKRFAAREGIQSGLHFRKIHLMAARRAG